MNAPRNHTFGKLSSTLGTKIVTFVISNRALRANSRPIASYFSAKNYIATITTLHCVRKIDCPASNALLIISISAGLSQRISAGIDRHTFDRAFMLFTAKRAESRVFQELISAIAQIILYFHEFCATIRTKFKFSKEQIAIASIWTNFHHFLLP
jgi:hypothetical protein